MEECLDKLRDTCLNRIREAFDREKSITTTLQIRRFEAYRDIYEEHYTAMNRRHIESDHVLLSLEAPLHKMMDKMVSIPPKADFLVPNSQGILNIMRSENLEEGQIKAALRIMAEVRSYYDCR